MPKITVYIRDEDYHWVQMAKALPQTNGQLLVDGCKQALSNEDRIAQLKGIIATAKQILDQA